jgi:hypothetical protein
MNFGSRLLLRAPSFDVIEPLADVLKVRHYQLFLPADKRQINVEGEIRVVLLELAKSQRATIKAFLEATLRAAKRIDCRNRATRVTGSP